MLLRSLDPSAAKKAVCKLEECLAAFLEGLAAAEGESEAAAAAASAAQRAAAAALRDRPQLGADLLELAKARASGPLAALLLEAAEGGGDEDEGEEADAGASAEGRGAGAAALPSPDALLAALLPVWVDKVQGAKERQPPGLLACWAPLLARADEEALADTLLPAAARRSKLAPEPGLAAAATLLGATRTDLSSLASGLWPALLQQARHSKEAVRALAVACARRLASRTSDPAVVGGYAAAAGAALDGSGEGGRPKSAAERGSLAALLGALAALPARGPAAARVAAPAAELLCAAYKAEPTGGCRGAGWAGGPRRPGRAAHPLLGRRTCCCKRHGNDCRTAGLSALLNHPPLSEPLPPPPTHT